MLSRGHLATSKNAAEGRAKMLALLEFGIHPIYKSDFLVHSPIIIRVGHRFGKCGHKYVRPAAWDDPRPRCIVCKAICPWRARSSHMPRPEGYRILITPMQIVRGDIFDDDAWGMRYKGMFVMKVTPGNGVVELKMHKDGRELTTLEVHKDDLVWIKPNG